jgi:predicted negative regulator of RcsB-dependent stress response
MKKTIITLLLFLLVTPLFSQNNNSVIWDALLKNDREKALKLVNKINFNKATDMESVVLKQVVINETGIFKIDDSFNSAFVSQKEYEYYLFALWNQNYIFTDYLKQGFKKQIYDNADFFYSQDVKLPVVKNALSYLKAISYQQKNNFDEYYKYYDKIDAIKDWQYCGVFENLNRSGINIEYPPEKQAISKEPFNANSNGKINWYIPVKKHKEAYQFFSNHLEYGSGINYAQTFINSPTDQTVYLNLGMGKATKVWLNDVLVFEQTKNRATDLDAFIVKLTIPKGTNRLLVKTTNDSYTYFIARILDKAGNPIPGLSYSSEYSEYNKSSKEQINAVLQPNVYEEFFKEKIKQNPENFFYSYCLINTYLRNSKEDEANKVLAPFVEKYPKSSLLRKILIQTYNLEEDYTKVKEVKENIENDDEDYYFSQLLKFADSEELFRLDVAEMNKQLDKIAASMDLSSIKHSCELLKYLREGDKSKVKNVLGMLIKDADDLESYKLKTTYASFYSSYFNEDKKTISLLKEIIDEYFYYTAYSSLARQYNKENQDEKAIKLYKDLLEKFPDDISTILKLVNKLQDIHRYEASLPYIEKALQNFPYSFVFMEKKGKALQQLKKKKEALVWYKKALAHNSGKTSLRNKINDLENIEDPIKDLIIKKPYDYIKENRGKITENNFGINYLLDEYNILLYEEGGLKSRGIYMYEITSDNGVEILKEYNLGLSGNYDIIKSEIVKPDGAIVPAEKSGSNFVFNDLSIGDVIYIDYEINSSSTGRFYKDFSDTYEFDSFHPSIRTTFRILVPDSISLNYQDVNGKVNFTKKRVGDLTLYEWTEGLNKGLPNSEDYMPELVDVARVIHTSTLDSWGEISNWYSDLVSSSIKYNKIVNETFETLFPDGFEKMTDDEKAKIIYDYIMDTMNYSYVDFKQSGFIPQRPSKTINSKLGDCKDLSTLFLTLGRKAGLKVNLVLVTTNDYGQNEMVLPSTNFNHCIAKVTLDGKDQFLELTDKNLPFKSLPTSLEGATALEIPYKKGEKLNPDLFKLKNVSQVKTILKSDIVYTISPDKQEISITITSQGRTNSNFNDLLKEPNEEVLKKNILKYFEDYDNLDLDLISYKVIQRDKALDQIKFQAVFTVKNKIQSLGKSKVFKLPLQLKPYTSNIINLEDRKYPIVYHKYEYIDQYESNYKIILKGGEKFMAIPEDQKFNYKNHDFSISYQKISDNELNVHVLSNTSMDTISTADYPAFKTYVQSIMETVESLIGFE